MRFVHRVAAFVAAFALSFGLAPTPVHANNFGSYLCGPDYTVSICVMSDATMYVYFSALEPNQEAATQWSITNNLNPTWLYASRTYSVPASDVNVYDWTYGFNGAWGWGYCPTTSQKGGVPPGQWCKPQYLKYNLSYPAAFDTLFEQRYMACHELGHIPGLRHAGTTSSCLWANQATSNYFTAHDNSCISSWYANGQICAP